MAAWEVGMAGRGVQREHGTEGSELQAARHTVYGN